MLGRTPGNIVAIRPMQDGVIADYTTTERMLEHLIRKATGRRGPFKPRVLVCVPAGVTSVERRAVLQAAEAAGAGEAATIEETMAAAIGAGLPIALGGWQHGRRYRRRHDRHRRDLPWWHRRLQEPARRRQQARRSNRPARPQRVQFADRRPNRGRDQDQDRLGVSRRPRGRDGDSRARHGGRASEDRGDYVGRGSRGARRARRANRRQGEGRVWKRLRRSFRATSSSGASR